jgi:predicted small lipoprotein YifL
VRRPLAALTIALALTALAGCGESGKSEADKTAGPGMNPTENASTASHYFRAVASNDPAQLTEAFALAAPESPALSYLHLVQEGLDATGTPDTVTENNGRFKICLADAPQTCHSYAAIVLTDGKINDFTIDGKKIRIR